MVSLLFFLTGCQLGLGKTKPTIILPEKTEISIEGDYLFENLFSLEGEEFIDQSGFRKFSATFSLEEAKVGLEKLENPSYSSKLVNTYDYFLEKYRMNPTELGIDQEKIEVVSITTQERQFYDVFKLGSDEIALIKGSNFIKLHRAGEEQMAILNSSNGGYGGTEEEDKTLVTEPIAGVLIGLRGARDEITDEASYRTLWITNDGEIQDVYEVEDLLFPRKEFWTLKVLPGSEENKGETLEIKAITGNLKNLEQAPFINDQNKKIDLTFLGNNYLSLRTWGEEWNDVSETMTISVDAKDLNDPISIRNVDGEEAETSFTLSMEEIVGEQEVLSLPPDSLDEYMESFILKRHHGNWRMVSEVILNDVKIQVPIAYKPSKNLVTYDEQPLSWKEIKKSVPQAEDAFCAPGNSFMLVRTSKYLMMYEFDGNQGLADQPLQKIEIGDDEKIIMAEWARGDFVSRWTDVVSIRGQRIIFVQN